jgi:hypothetical protein
MNDFTGKEEQCVRAALRFLRLRCGSWSALAPALHFDASTLAGVASGRKIVSGTMAIRIAKFAKVGVDDVLTGKFPAVGTCPHCGHRKEEKEPAA